MAEMNIYELEAHDGDEDEGDGLQRVVLATCEARQESVTTDTAAVMRMLCVPASQATL